MDLTVVIPTRNRRQVLHQALRRLGAQEDEARFEVIVVDDGSSDGTPDAVRAFAQSAPFPVVLLEQPPQGPAAARNAAIARARAPVCLFLNDDSWARPGLLARHCAFHATHPAAEDALLGAITLPAEPQPTPFMRWLEGLHFDFGSIVDASNAGGGRFFTLNVSAKVELVRRAAGFDETFANAAYEDLDLGLRLEQHGLRLAFDRGAVVEHAHPLDLPDTIARFRRHARSLRDFRARHPSWPEPTCPAARHRLRAAVLTGLALVRIRSRALQHETWRFLCHEATREGDWEPGEDPPGGVRIGSTLARLASRDAAARIPPSGT